MGFGNIGEAIIEKAAKLGTNVTKEAVENVAKEAKIAKTAAKIAGKDSDKLWYKTGEALNATGRYSFDLQADKEILNRIRQSNNIQGKTDLTVFAESFNYGQWRADEAKRIGAKGKSAYNTRVQNMANPNANLEDIKAQKAGQINAEKIRQEGLKSNNDIGGGYSGSELDDLYEQSRLDTNNKVSATGTYSSQWEQKTVFQNTEDLNNIFNQIAATERQNQINYSNAIANGTTYTASEPVTNKLRAEIAPPQNDAFSEKILNGLGSDTTFAEVTETQRIKAGYSSPGKVRQVPLEEANTNDFNRIFNNIDKNEKSVIDSLNQELGQNDTAWSSTARAVLGTAVGGAALCAALSSSRGQQNNAQLYGQQSLY